jgi:hypothetical protein
MMLRRLLVLSIALGSCALADSDNLLKRTYPGSQAAGELRCEAHYFLWLPPDTPILRGVIIHQHGCGDGAEKGCLEAARDLHWQALARKHGCALLGPSYRGGDGNCVSWAEPRHGSAKRLRQALADFAVDTKHPELATAPWCLWGHSGGGWWASTMAALHPERTVAVWLKSGSAYGAGDVRDTTKDMPPPDVTPAVRQIPIVANPGALEETDEKFGKCYHNPLAHFKAWRAEGALIAFAPGHNERHECGNSRYLAIPFFDECLTQRLPKNGGALRLMATEKAWLGSHEDRQIQAAPACSDANQRSWFPTEALAKSWQHYLKGEAIPDPTPPPAPTNARWTPEGLRWDAVADLESGLGAFVIECDGKPLVTLPERARPGEPFQGLSFHDTPNQPPVELRHQLKPGTSGAKYRVIAVNTAGLKSEPSASATSP